jgi:probable F420-dependent oxidoreductase
VKAWLSLQSLPLDTLTAVAVECERLGVEGVTVSDHLCVPQSIASEYPYTGRRAVLPVETEFPDPMTLVAHLGAQTGTLRFMTHVLLVALRHPVVLAKEIATVQRLCDGRFDLGVGVGWLEEEFDALGVDFHKRGAITDESLVVMRELWTGRSVAHHGNSFRFDSMSSLPCPVSPVSVMAGGYSQVALRRAATLDGWLGVTPAIDELERLLAALVELRREFDDLDRQYSVRTGIKGTLTPRLIDSAARLGVDALIVTPHQLGVTIDLPTDEVVGMVGSRIGELVDACAATSR